MARSLPLARHVGVQAGHGRVVVYNRSIFLISFLKEVFLRSVILFQSGCFS